MKLFETKKNIKEMQNMKETQTNKEQNENNNERPKYVTESSVKQVFVNESEYGWDGDY